MTSRNDLSTLVSLSSPCQAACLFGLTLLGCAHGAVPAPSSPVSASASSMSADESPPPPDAAIVPSPVPPTREAPAVPREGVMDAAQGAAGTRLSVEPAETLAVGKWPEGIAVTNDAIWVAESGLRRVSRLSREAPHTARPSRVGRLPVDLVLGEDGSPFGVVATDRKLVTIAPATGRVKTVAETPDYATALCAARGTLWALLYDGGSSANSTVLRVAAASGETRRSGQLGPNAFDIAEGHGKLWIARSEALTVVDPDSLAKLADVPLEHRPMHVLAGPGGVYVGSSLDVVRVDPASLTVSHRLPLGERVTAMAPYGEQIAVLSERGTLWLLASDTLTPRATLTTQASEAHAMVAEGDALFVTVHQGQGENGSVLVFRPSAEQPWH